MSVAAARALARFREEPLRPGVAPARPNGRLMIIGGKEDKEDDKLILRRFVELVGSGRLVVVTTATEEPEETWEEYEQVFRGLGAPHVYHYDVEAREDADSLRAMKILEDATGVVITGGDQLKLTSIIGDTPSYSRMLEVLLEGGVIGGTSAGASVMSDTMLIGGGQNGSHRLEDNLRLAPGFGFAKDLVIDQHFAERGRVSRLMAVIGQNPRVIGIGLDENTAIEMRPGRDFRVIGEGGVTILDGRRVKESNFAEEDAERTMSLFNVTLHLLSQGDSFNLSRRTPKMGSAAAVEDELGVAAH